MKSSKQSLSQSLPKKTAEASLSALSLQSGSGQKASGAMMERQASPLESEVERIFRNWDIGRRNCGWGSGDKK